MGQFLENNSELSKVRYSSGILSFLSCSLPKHLPTSRAGGSIIAAIIAFNSSASFSPLQRSVSKQPELVHSPWPLWIIPFSRPAVVFSSTYNRVVSLRVIEKSCAWATARVCRDPGKKRERRFARSVTTDQRLRRIQTRRKLGPAFCRASQFVGTDSDKSRQENVWQTSGYSRDGVVAGFRLGFRPETDRTRCPIVERDEWTAWKVRHRPRR